MSSAPVAQVEQSTKEDLIWGIDFRRQIPSDVGITSFSITRYKRNTEEAPVSVSGSQSGSVITFQTGTLLAAIYTFEVVVTLSNGEDKESSIVIEVLPFLDPAGVATQTEKEDLIWGVTFAPPSGESIISFTLTRYLDGVATDVTGSASQDENTVMWATGDSPFLSEGVYLFEATVTLSNTEILSSTVQITVVP